MDIRYDPDDPADLWKNITPVTPAQFLSGLRDHCRICGAVSIGAVCATCTASGEVLAEPDADPGAFDSAPGHG